MKWEQLVDDPKMGTALGETTQVQLSALMKVGLLQRQLHLQWQVILRHVCGGGHSARSIIEYDAKSVLQGCMSGFKHELSYTMTVTQMSHSISILKSRSLKIPPTKPPRP